MRITSAQKAANRERILDRAVQLFAQQGFAETTTRDLAVAAEIATGTLFNYFPTKEAIVVALIERALRDRPLPLAAGEGDLEERLFALAAGEMRCCRPLRSYVHVWLETALSPLLNDSDEISRAIRAEHLELVANILQQATGRQLSPVASHLYWTLHTGVLAFWGQDKSPQQEDTLALLDESLAMFVAWLYQQPEE